MSGLHLDPESLSLVVHQAILDSITPEAREQLLSDAIKSLLTVPPKPASSYGRPLDTPLKEAFSSAVHVAARKLVIESIENDPKVAEALRAVVHPLVADLCAGNYDGLPEAIGSAFGDWLRERA